MLARRFTMICLLTSIFGMLFANLAVRSEPSPFNDTRSQQLRCAVTLQIKC